MKKSVWMLGAAIVALTSCTQSEVLDMAQSKAIGFSTFVEKPTKATNDIGDASTDFAEFYVFGAKGTVNTTVDGNGIGIFTQDDNDDNPETTTIVPYLNEVKVYKDANGGWTYNPHKSWTADKTFRFAAYANGKGNGSASAAKLNNVIFKPQATITENGNERNVWGLDINNYEVSDKDLLAATGHRTKCIM